MHPVLSVVVPVYNEEEVLPLLVERLRPVLDGTGEPYEVVAVDDGSKDASAVVMQRIRRTWPEFRIVRLRANAGHQAAISAGLARARGDYMVTIDADLQDPPEVVARMLSTAQNEHLDVVYGVRNDRSSDTAFKRGTAQAFYGTMRRLSGTDAPANAGDFRLMSRATVDAVNALPEHHRVLRLVVPALGFPSGEVYYKREERAAGESKYPLRKMIGLSIDSLTAHSMAPLRLATWAGLLGVIGALVIMLYALFSSMSGRAIAGWTSTVMAVAAVGAVQLVCLGILGEYVGRMYRMMQGRPTYFVAHDTDGDNDRDFTSELDDEDIPAAVVEQPSRHSRGDRGPRRPRGATAVSVAAAPEVAVAPLPDSTGDFETAIQTSHDGGFAAEGRPATSAAETAREAESGEHRPATVTGSSEPVEDELWDAPPDTTYTPSEAADEAPMSPPTPSRLAADSSRDALSVDSPDGEENVEEDSLVGATAHSVSVSGGGTQVPRAAGPAVVDAEARQAVRRSSAKRVTPGSEEVGR